MYWYVTRANEIPRLRAEHFPGLLEQSKRIARDIDHAASAGEEGIRKVLDDLQPKAFDVARGFIFSSDSEPPTIVGGIFHLLNL
jgi:hypothetical protein